MADIACPACGRSNPDDAVSCAHCGAPLAAPGRWYPTEERKVVTVVFVDLSDFTTLGSRLDPEATRTLVARFFAAARDEIRRFGGSVEKFIGDAVMAVFGLPAANEDDPARAVEAALAIRRRLETLNDSFRAEFGLAVSIHAGINTGEVLAAVGPAEGRDFLITGDAVNIAARLHEQARPNQILVGERTYRFGRRFFDFRPAGPLTVKGRDEALPAWEVTAALPAVAPRVAARLVGRAEELTRLRAIAAETFAARRPHIAVVTGNPGIGKSRLVAEFREGFAPPDHPIFRSGRCLPRGEAITYLPLADILKHESGVADADTAAVARTKIAAALEPLGAGEVADSLAYTIGLDVPDSPVSQLDPRAVGQELVRAWRVFFEAKARPHPLVIIFEDLHWAGDPLLELIETVVRGTTDAPLLFIATARPDLGERRRRWGQTGERRTVIRLDPLSRRESEDLLETLVPGDVPPKRLRETIVDRAEGNPFFIEEMVRMLADDGVLVQEAGRWRLGRAVEYITLPDTIHAVIAARIDHLPAAEKATLQQAAVIGRTFWLGALRALAGASEVGDAIEALDRKEFIQDGRQPVLPGEREYAFRHVLIHEVAYGSLPRGARGRMHQQVGEWLERTAAPRVSEAVDLLAHHFREAALLTGAEAIGQRARGYLRQAAGSAYRRYALDQALAHAHAALALGEIEHRPALEEMLGDVLFTMGRLSEAEQHYREALRGYTGPLDQARIHRKLVPTVGVGPRIDLAVEELARAEHLLAVEPNRAEHAALLIWKGRLAHHRMRYDDAVDAFTQAGRVLEDSGNRSGLAWSQCFLGSTLVHVGQFAQAFSLGRQAESIARAIRDPQLMALAYGVLQEVRLLRGEYDAALQEEEADLVAATAAGDAELKARVLRILGTVLYRRGKLGEAAARLAEAQEVGEPERGRAFAASELVVVLADLGRVEEATQAADLAWTVAVATQHPELTMRAEIAALYLHVAVGRPGERLGRCEDALRRSSTSRLLTMQALAVIAAARADLNDAAGVEAAAHDCALVAGRAGAPYESLMATQLLGRAEMLRGRWGRAIALLSEAADGFARLPALLEHGRVLLRLAEAQASADYGDDARLSLDTAVRTLSSSEAVTDLRRARQVAARLGVAVQP